MTENGTYIRNTDFPQALSGDDIDDCSFEINKCQDGKLLEFDEAKKLQLQAANQQQPNQE